MNSTRPTTFHWMRDLTAEHKALLNTLVRAGCNVRASVLHDDSIRVSVSHASSLIVERTAPLLNDAFADASSEASDVLFGRTVADRG